MKSDVIEHYFRRLLTTASVTIDHSSHTMASFTHHDIVVYTPDCGWPDPCTNTNVQRYVIVLHLFYRDASTSTTPVRNRRWTTSLTLTPLNHVPMAVLNDKKLLNTNPRDQIYYRTRLKRRETLPWANGAGVQTSRMTPSGRARRTQIVRNDINLSRPFCSAAFDHGIWSTTQNGAGNTIMAVHDDDKLQ